MKFHFHAFGFCCEMWCSCPQYGPVHVQDITTMHHHTLWSVNCIGPCFINMSAAKREQVTKHEHTDFGQHWGRMTFSCPPGEAAPTTENISHAKGEVAQMYTVPKDNLHELVCGREMHDNYGGVSWGLITSIIQACSAGIHTCQTKEKN